MDKEILAYLNGERNALDVRLIVSREVTPAGTEHVFIKLPDSDICLYDFWYNPKENKKANKNQNPKHIGGKRPFVKLFLQELDKLRDKGLSDEMAGNLLRLVKYITWSTGILANKRSKKPLKFEDMVRVLGLSKSYTYKRIKQFKDLGILSHTKEGYMVAPNLIKKGGVENKNNYLPTGV